MKDLRRTLETREFLSIIGAHDGLTGILGERAGFDAIWGSGFEIATSFGVPDASILTMTEQLERCRQINEAVHIPVVADCDSGYGNAINAAVAARKFESAGMSAICIEDALFPKRCSFYEGVTRGLVPVGEHARKIRACKDAQRTSSFVVIARTEAFIVGAGLDEALERASAYADAGADAILVHSKESSPEQILEFGRHWKGRLPLIAVPTTYDTVNEAELKTAGYRVAIYANHGIRSAIRAIEENLRLLRESRQASVLRDRIAPLEQVFDLVNMKQLRADEQLYLKTTPLSEESSHAPVVSKPAHLKLADG